MHRYDGILKISATRGSGRPSIALLGFILPAVCLAMHGIADWHILEWHNVWLPSVLSAFGFAAILLIYVNEVRRDVLGAIICYIICAAYGYGAALELNGILAVAPPTPYPAEIAKKYTQQDRSKTLYRFTLKPWGPRHIKITVWDVSRAEYEHFSVGDTITEWVRVGIFGIPYYSVRKIDMER